MLYGLKLQVEQRRRFDTDDQGRRFGQHAPAVITVAATDVENPAAPQRGQMRQYARPFQVRTPLAVDQYIDKPVRSLAPGHQPFERRAQRAVILALSSQRDRRGGKVGTDLPDLRQIRKRRGPARIIAMPDQPAGARLFELRRPAPETRAVELPPQMVPLHRLIAR